MEPFANVFVRKTHLSVKNMQFSMQLHRRVFKLFKFHYLWLMISSQFGNVLTNRLNSS